MSNAFVHRIVGTSKKNILLMPNTLPSSEYETSTTLKKLKLTYNVIDGGPCMVLLKIMQHGSTWSFYSAKELIHVHF
jgi:hypothetical protein